MATITFYANIIAGEKMKSDIEYNLKGQRNSKNRDSVIAILLKESMPVSVEDIFYKIKTQNSKVSLSTVYRILDKLCDLQIVRKAATDGGRALYELVRNGHRHYIICTKCKKMVALDNCPITELEKKICSDTGFHITGHKYEIFGECKDCYNK